MNHFPALALACALTIPAMAQEEIKSVTFDQPVSTHEWSLKEINPALPSDWTGFNYLVVEFRAASSERFELNLEMTPKPVSKRIHPFAGVWVRASIPLRYYRQGLGNGSDLAATVNQPRNSYWINIESGGYGPVASIPCSRAIRMAGEMIRSSSSPN